MTGARVATLVLTLLLARGGLAEPAAVAAAAPGGDEAAAERARHLDASPESPQFGADWRGAARARLGGELPLLGRRVATPLALELVGLLELHNGPAPDSAIPNESWRGRLAIEGWWRAVALPRRRHELGLVLEHESDHDTARVDSEARFLSLNALAFEMAHWAASGALSVELRGALRYHSFTCTRLGACDEPTDGQTTLGGSVGMGADFGPSLCWRRVAPFAALELSALAPRRDIVAEQRLVAQLGFYREGRYSGRWQLFALAFLGNDVGLQRAQRLRQLGVGLRWTPLWSSPAAVQGVSVSEPTSR